MLERLELVLTQIAALERQRDAILDEAEPGDAERMIQQLVRLRGIGVQSATLLVREAFVRPFASGKALGAYAGLSPTPYSSGSTEREQGIGRAGNARLRTVLVELAWIWQRYQPGSAMIGWFRDRLGGATRRLRKVMVVALARKLLIALWRFATQGVVPEGAVLEPAV
jgi:transposase